MLNEVPGNSAKRRGQLAWSWVVVVLLLGWASTARAEEIRELVVAENAKTTDSTVLYIADLEKELAATKILLERTKK